MRHLSAGIDVRATPGDVWRLITEFEHWPEWGASIRAVESGAQQVAQDVTGRVQTVAGFWLPFRICDVTPGRSWMWEVAGVGATGHHVIPKDDGHSRVEFTAPWIAGPYLAVLHHSLRRLRRLAEQP